MYHKFPPKIYLVNVTRRGQVRHQSKKNKIISGVFVLTYYGASYK